MMRYNNYNNYNGLVSNFPTLKITNICCTLPSTLQVLSTPFTQAEKIQIPI